MDKTKCENCGAEVKDGVLIHRLWGCREIDLVKNVFSKKNKDLYCEKNINTTGEVTYTFPELHHNDIPSRQKIFLNIFKPEDIELLQGNIYHIKINEELFESDGKEALVFFEFLDGFLKSKQFNFIVKIKN